MVRVTLRSILILATAAILLTLAGCQGLLQQGSVTANPDLTPINHIVVMVQENRSFDSYFGQLPAYWAANGYPSQQFDGLPKGASNPSFSGSANISAFHVATMCIENLSPFWNESHLDWNLQDPGSSTAEMNGFVWNAGNFATNENLSGANPKFTDTDGVRAMGYYDGSDLNYYYFMASKFATSDRWFAPAMDRTQINRMYLYAATSQGYVYPPGSFPTDNAALTAATIFDALNKAQVSWKIYYSDDICSTIPGDSEGPVGGMAQTSSKAGACTYLTQFKEFSPPNPLPSNVVPVSQYLSDVKNGTLPSVAFIEAGFLSNRDEHPSPGTNVQTGAAYMQSLIDPLMNSVSWKDTVFILTYDEPGGLYDHVAAQPEPNPDGIAPKDLQPTDQCYGNSGGMNCNFNSTGFRVPLIVISPFTKKNYVSHTVADYTAMLKLIESRFSLPALTKRDAAQIDMSEFFDFKNVPWATPPSPPAQNTNGVCNATVLQ